MREREREREKVKIIKSSFYTTVTKICLVGCKVLVSLWCQYMQYLGILIFLDWFGTSRVRGYDCKTNIWRFGESTYRHKILQYIDIRLNAFLSLILSFLCMDKLQMKGWRESNINVWVPIMSSQNWNCYFQNRIIMFCLPVPELIYLWDIYIFPGSVCLFCCRKICGRIYKSLTDTWRWKLGQRPRNSQKRNI